MVIAGIPSVVGSVCTFCCPHAVKYVADVGLRIMIRKGDCDVNGVDVAVTTLLNESTHA